jgi:REP element-mobilizing transposase RayT
VPNHRAQLPDGLFHVFARSIPERPLFVDDHDRLRFLAELREASRRHRLVVHASCLMGTHYHAVIEATTGDLSCGLQRLHSLYALACNERHRRFGHVFAERFACRSIGDDVHLRDACAYVLLNPVRAGLCDRIEEWPWSSCRFGLDAI